MDIELNYLTIYINPIDTDQNMLNHDEFCFDIKRIKLIIVCLK